MKNINIKTIKKLTMIFLLIIILVGMKIYLNLENKIALEIVAINNGVKVPMVMYHQILKEPKTWSKYVISPEDFEKDIVYLIEKGYTTVTMQDLIDYTYEKKPLPEKPIVITFDDGYLTNLEYIVPILEKHNAKAVFSVVGEYTDRFTKVNDRVLSYAHMSWNDVKAMVDNPHAEIQNHSYNMHSLDDRRGVAKKKGESMEEYRKILENDILYLQNLIKEKTGYTPTTFTYPFGELSSAAEKILKEIGFKATLTSTEGINILTGNPNDLYYMKRYNRPCNINRDEFFGKFD